jgi:hypothetical protein
MDMPDRARDVARTEIHEQRLRGSEARREVGEHLLDDGDGFTVDEVRHHGVLEKRALDNRRPVAAGAARGERVPLLGGVGTGRSLVGPAQSVGDSRANRVVVGELSEGVRIRSTLDQLCGEPLGRRRLPGADHALDQDEGSSGSGTQHVEWNRPPTASPRSASSL